MTLGAPPSVSPAMQRTSAWPDPVTRPSIDSSLPSTQLPQAPTRPSGRCDVTGSAASCTSMCRSHDVTAFSAPTRLQYSASE
jgi:hypothetical protein